MSTTKIENPEDSQKETKSSDDLVWASEVLTVYRNLGKSVGKRALGSSSAKMLHDWGSNPENQEKFLAVMVPKATDILAKHRKDDTPDAITQAEYKSITELQRFLKEELEKSVI